MRNPVNTSEADKQAAVMITKRAISLYKKALTVESKYSAEYMTIVYEYETEVLAKCGKGKIQDVCPPTLPGISHVPERLKAEAFHKIEVINKTTDPAEKALRIRQLDEACKNYEVIHA